MGKCMSKKYDKVPELSLRQYTDGSEADRTEFCQALYDGFKHFGFIILKDHPVSTELLDKAYDRSQAFFELNEPTKKSYVQNNGHQRGYSPFGKEHAKNSKYPDLKEFWHVGRDFKPDSSYAKQHPENLWPKEVEGFQDTMTRLFRELDETGQIMLEALTPSLDLPKDYFRDLAGQGNSILRLLHYPPVPDDVDPNCVRAAAHEDINLITVLVAASQSGLELLDRDGKWLPVETDKNNLIVDAGDMLSRITNEVIPSTTHRVVNPTGPNLSRYSMPFFIHPNSDAMLKCIPSCIGDGAKYPEILADDFLSQRLKEIGLR